MTFRTEKLERDRRTLPPVPRHSCKILPPHTQFHRSVRLSHRRIDEPLQRQVFAMVMLSTVVLLKNDNTVAYTQLNNLSAVLITSWHTGQCPC